MKPTFDVKQMVFLVADPEVEETSDYEPGDVLEMFREGDDLPKGILILPARYEVCGRCDGKGTHWHESLDNGITQEDRERDWDADSWDQLINHGLMDVQCKKCHGQRVVPVPMDTISAPEARKALQIFEEWHREEADYAALCAMERRMGG